MGGLGMPGEGENSCRQNRCLFLRSRREKLPFSKNERVRGFGI
jgi:hypothetical protein